MTPYNVGARIFIDKNIKEFLFGEVPKELMKQVGRIDQRKHLNAKRCMTYGVVFENDEGKDIVYWFKETELIILYT